MLNKNSQLELIINYSRSPSDEDISTTSAIPSTLSPAINTNNNTFIPPNGKRRSAFSPYKPTATVLTNLQRGNTQADVQTEICLSFHERSGQGEITDEQARQQPFIDAFDNNHFTALHWACFYGQMCSVKILVKYGANVSQLALDMVTPLLLAAAGGHHEIVRLLLQHGANPNHMDVVCYLAFVNSRITLSKLTILCVLFLLFLVQMGNTALMYAAAGNHPHTCTELLNNYPNVFERNENDSTAYSLAIKNNANLAQAVLENYIVSLLTA